MEYGNQEVITNPTKPMDTSTSRYWIHLIHPISGFHDFLMIAAPPVASGSLWRENEGLSLIRILSL